MRRRDFIRAVAGSAAIAWPLAAQAQQAEQVRRIGALLPATADDAVFQSRLGVFLQELAILGWAIGRNLRIDVRWASADAGEIRRRGRTKSFPNPRCSAIGHVHFTPESGHVRCTTQCLLWADSGHVQCS